MTAEDVVELYSGLLARGVRLWVDGGWGIDALLRRQTRQHKDLDAIVAFGELPVLARFLLGRGFALKLVWEENRWAPCPEPPALVGRERPAAQAATAFVLEDGSGREIDFHVVRLDEHGRWTPAWNTDLVFPSGALAGVGTVGGTRVRCLSARMQMRTHTCYALEESDLHDMRFLHDRFGVDYPEEVADLFSRLGTPTSGSTCSLSGRPRIRLPQGWVNRKLRTLNDAARRVFLIPSIRTGTTGGALRMEGQNLPDLEQMDVNQAVRVGKSSITTGGTNTTRRTG